MVCPYCAERIAAQAVVCPHCQRDLLFFVPVQRELRAQAKRIDALELQNAKLVAVLARHWAPLGDASPLAQATTAGAAVEASASDSAAAAVTPASATASPALGWLSGLARVALPVAALVLAHAIIVLGLDLNQIWLRVASILIPLAFGFGFATRWSAPLGLHAGCAFVIALVSVAAMSGAVAHMDDVPFWPQDLREWREMAYYAASIMFSDLTGVLLARLVQRWHQRSTVRVLAQLNMQVGGTPVPGRAQQMRKRAEELRDLIALVTPIITAVVSVGTGIVAFFK